MIVDEQVHHPFSSTCLGEGAHKVLRDPCGDHGHFAKLLLSLTLHHGQSLKQCSQNLNELELTRLYSDSSAFFNREGNHTVCNSTHDRFSFVEIDHGHQPGHRSKMTGSPFADPFIEGENHKDDLPQNLFKDKNSTIFESSYFTQSSAINDTIPVMIDKELFKSNEIINYSTPNPLTIHDSIDHEIRNENLLSIPDVVNVIGHVCATYAVQDIKYDKPQDLLHDLFHGGGFSACLEDIGRQIQNTQSPFSYFVVPHPTAPVYVRVCCAAGIGIRFVLSSTSSYLLAELEKNKDTLKAILIGCSFGNLDIDVLVKPREL